MNNNKAEQGDSALGLPETRFGREDIPPRERSRWSILIPGSRVRLGAGTVMIIVFVVGLLALSVLVFPEWIVSEPSGLGDLKGKDRVAAESTLEQTRNSVRTTLVQAIGGALVLLTFAVGLGQLITARKGQIIDRFTKTIDQLGSDKVDVRLGGIYALEQMAADREYARPIAEIFAAYLKTHATGERESSNEESESALELVRRGARKFLIGEATERSSKEHEASGLRPDLQAVLRILILEGLWNRAILDRLDLSHIAVTRAELRRAKLTRTVLLRAALRQADLSGAELQDVDLREADLTGAWLKGATLTRVDLTGARLIGARLDQAKLEKEVLLRGARLNEAELRGADFDDADFTGANLSDAKLNGAKLTRKTVLDEAKLVGAKLEGAILVGTRLRKSDLTRADFTGADLTGADLTGAILTEANLTGANLTGASLLGTVGLNRAETDDVGGRKS
jgi:uncharacterized protein YjbI with pentapeptide repeats